jgi:hypothetical protein
LTAVQALARTRWATFLGAADTPQLRAALEKEDAAVLLFEPDRAAFDAFASSFGPERLARVLCIAGDPRALPRPLGRLLPPELADLGSPLILEQAGLSRAFPGFARAVAEAVEVHHFRRRVLPLMSQYGRAAIPYRPMTRSMFYDQLANCYDNLADYLRCPPVDALENALAGRTAILVGAGPGLDDRLEFIRRHADDAVVIAVNNSLKPLVAAGVEPHFCCTFDATLAVERSFAGLGGLATALVAHCASRIPEGVFERVFLFDNYMAPLFGRRRTLPAHASVLITAYSLARLLGCEQAVLVGAHFASPDPWAFGYAKDAIHSRDVGDAEQRPLIHRFPQLYPARDALGRRCYTLPAYLDACHWFRDEIREAGLPAVNLNADSLLHGEGVEVDEGFDFAGEPGVARAVAAIAARPPRLNSEAVRQAALREIGFWRDAAKELEGLAAAPDPERFREALARFDANNVSFLIERCPGFDPALFRRQWLQGEAPEQGMRLYAEAGSAMARGFVSSLARQLQHMARRR